MSRKPRKEKAEQNNIMKNRQSKKLLSACLSVAMFAGYFYVPHASWSAVSIGLAAALMLVFFSKESIEDERVENLKMKAIQGAFGLAFGVMLFLQWKLRRSNGVSGTLQLPSAFDMIIVTMLIALSLFYYWRWRDAR